MKAPCRHLRIRRRGWKGDPWLEKKYHSLTNSLEKERKGTAVVELREKRLIHPAATTDEVSCRTVSGCTSMNSLDKERKGTAMVEIQGKRLIHPATVTDEMSCRTVSGCTSTNSLETERKSAVMV
jgi:hypothetical protein